YVDKSYVGTSDGTSSAPFKGLPAAISAADPGAIVALAPGNYAYLTLETKPVRLWGKCPGEVNFTNGIYVKGQASGTELHRLGVTSIGNIGILVENTDVAVDETWVHDVPHVGVYVYTLNDSATASLTLRRSLVEQVTTHGAYNQGCELTVDESVIRDVAPQGDQKGEGIRHYWETGQSQGPGTVEVTASLVERVHRAGIRMWLGAATVTATAVRDVVANVGEDEGTGIFGLGEDGHSASLTLDGVTIEGTTFAGVLTVDGDLTARRVTVREVVASPLSQVSIGLACLATGNEGRPQMVVREASIADVEQMGLDGMGADALVEGVVVKNVTGVTDMAGAGAGIAIEADPLGGPSLATLRGVAIENVEALGLYVGSSEVTLSEIAVRGVAPHTATGTFGRGIALEYQVDRSVLGSEASLQNCAVQDVNDTGVSVLGSSADITSCLIDGVTIPPAAPNDNGEPGSFGIYVQQALDTALPATAAIDHVVIDHTLSVGIAVAAATATIDGSIVRDVGASGQLLGDGIAALSVYYLQPTPLLVPASVEVTGSQVTGAHRAGLSAFSSALSLSGNEVSCNAIALNGETFYGVPFEITDDGDNWCGCDGLWSECKVLTSSLVPPPPVGPGK
ncbi:MAG: DUF1565 domain-containing protein, partial [Deltaproteobacteria bacterium]|nr:DUF1565 domain-containing protein [Deltaproteobacteria bacterium]